MSDVIIGHLRVTTTAEVRDAAGNVVSTSPLVLSRPVTAAELAEYERTHTK